MRGSPGAAADITPPQITGDRFASIQRVALAYAGVPADADQYTWITAPWECPAVEVPLQPEPTEPMAQVAITGPQVARIIPGRPDVHAGWRFRFGYHSRARYAALWIEE